MLPRADMFKEVIFIPRLIAFNESFVPVGQYTKSVKPLAVVWHEAIQGRKKEDLVSTFYAFLLRNRDVPNITIWLDNCAAQNKNWALFCFCIYAVNCSELALKTFEIKYFQSGHTFMSADSFHHQVEQSLKKMGKVFDFDDFKSAVNNANSSKVDVKDMTINDFFDWKDFSSKYKIQRINPKPYLQDMSHLLFKEGEYVMWYKNNFLDDDFVKLNFLIAKYFKDGVPKPSSKQDCRGISEMRKNSLILKLRPIIPESRLKFWEQLPVCADNKNDDDSDVV